MKYDKYTHACAHVCIPLSLSVFEPFQLGGGCIEIMSHSGQAACVISFPIVVKPAANETLAN